jgi:phosphatidylserine synthase
LGPYVDHSFPSREGRNLTSALFRGLCNPVVLLLVPILYAVDLSIALLIGALVVLADLSLLVSLKDPGWRGEAAMIVLMVIGVICIVLIILSPLLRSDPYRQLSQEMYPRGAPSVEKSDLTTGR